VFDPKIKNEVLLDTEITPQLKEEALVREVIRHIQEMRKKAKLRPFHEILICCQGGEGLERILMKHKELILKETRAQDFLLSEKPEEIFDIEKEITLEGEILRLRIKRVK